MTSLHELTRQRELLKIQQAETEEAVALRDGALAKERAMQLSTRDQAQYRQDILEGERIQAAGAESAQQHKLAMTKLELERQVRDG